ncbi:uncharacterized protein LOC126162594 [Schistocerca cancellata]|uniref:uncharacterized protein LOC126162594 n=1 Tax=Schistocerca cancellata TaxID=274614 RepID=UPI002117A969|nr:uncharacterized protein LOC126162594 [Schistocerca cancellata]
MIYCAYSMRWLQAAISVLAGSALCLQTLNEVQQSASCCSRRHKMQLVGEGLNGKPIKTDVGHCHKECSSTSDSLELIDEVACDAEWLCRPSASQLRRVWTRLGVREVSVVESCECVPRPPACTRLPHVLAVFPGTPFQEHIDVGTCHGHCHQGGGCRASRTRTVSVAGPNGAQCHSVIEECSCAPACHRLAHFETVYDYTGNASEPTVLEVDVGRCDGGSAGAGGPAACEGRSFSRCVHRSPGGACVSSLQGPLLRCTPAEHREHYYRDATGATRTIIAVNSCICG